LGRRQGWPLRAGLIYNRGGLVFERTANLNLAGGSVVPESVTLAPSVENGVIMWT
jgi:hypothetical protein